MIMESNAFGSAHHHIPSQALVVLSEAASGLHEALRGQRPFPSRLPDAKDLHNMSLVGSYGTHLLHTFHPHLLQTLNHHGMLTANSNAAAAAAANYFANERANLSTKPSAAATAAMAASSVLTNFQLPSAFSPPKYIGLTLDQNLFNGNDSFRTDSASPTCTSHESLEGSNDYDGASAGSGSGSNSACGSSSVGGGSVNSSGGGGGGGSSSIEKVESPRSSIASDSRDLRHGHSNTKLSTSTCTSSMAVSAAAAAAAVASIAQSSSTAAVVAANTATVAAAAAAAVTHLAHQPGAQHAHQYHHHHPGNSHHQQHQHHQPLHQHHPQVTHSAHHLAALTNHHHAHAHAHAHAHHANGSLLAAASMSHTLSLAATHGCGALRPSPPNHVPELCPVCGLKLTNDEWNSHFLTELDRLYKLSSGMERASLQATYMFAPPCPAQENAIRTSHNRWETFQRIRNNRQNRLRLKVRKRKYGDMFFMENMLCSSCPICKRKYGLDNLSSNGVGVVGIGSNPNGVIEEDPDAQKMQEDIETVDVESCNDEIPDSVGSDLQQQQQSHHPLQLHGHGHGNTMAAISGNLHNSHHSANLHNSNSQPGKLDGILYRTTTLIINNKEHTSGNLTGGGLISRVVAGSNTENGEDDISTNVATTTTITSSTGNNHSGQSDWPELTAHSNNSNNSNQAQISVKNVSELSSTTTTAIPNSTHHYYPNADSCLDEQQQTQHQLRKDSFSLDMCNNDSDEDVIVDDEESFKISSFNNQHHQSHHHQHHNQHNRKRKYEDSIVGSTTRLTDNRSPLEERPRSEPQVTSTENNLEIHHICNNNNNNNSNNNNTKYMIYEDLRLKQSPDSESLHSSHTPQQNHIISKGHTTGHLELSTAKVGITSDLKPETDESKCFICKTGIKDLTATDNFLRGRNFYFHQSCANVMNSYRFNKDLPTAATTATATTSPLSSTTITTTAITKIVPRNTVTAAPTNPLLKSVIAVTASATSTTQVAIDSISSTDKIGQ